MTHRSWLLIVFSRRILVENEPDYYSGYFFLDRLEATNVKMYVQLLITVLLKYWQRI